MAEEVGQAEGRVECRQQQVRAEDRRAQFIAQQTEDAGHHRQQRDDADVLEALRHGRVFLCGRPLVSKSLKVYG